MTKKNKPHKLATYLTPLLMPPLLSMAFGVAYWHQIDQPLSQFKTLFCYIIPPTWVIFFLLTNMPNCREKWDSHKNHTDWFLWTKKHLSWFIPALGAGVAAMAISDIAPEQVPLTVGFAYLAAWFIPTAPLTAGWLFLERPSPACTQSPTPTDSGYTRRLLAEVQHSIRPLLATVTLFTFPLLPIFFDILTIGTVIATFTAGFIVAVVIVAQSRIFNFSILPLGHGEEFSTVATWAIGNSIFDPFISALIELPALGPALLIVIASMDNLPVIGSGLTLMAEMIYPIISAGLAAWGFSEIWKSVGLGSREHKTTETEGQSLSSTTEPRKEEPAERKAIPFPNENQTTVKIYRDEIESELCPVINSSPRKEQSILLKIALRDIRTQQNRTLDILGGVIIGLILMQLRCLRRSKVDQREQTDSAESPEA